MVCKECGAYNAEHLTHCRVCAAKLKDYEPAVDQAAQDPGRPSRRFAQAPTWPKEAYEGAAASAAPAQEEFVPEEAPPKPMTEPMAPRAAEPKAAQATPRAAAKVEAPKPVCSNCGKPLLSDAPFCAYCGTRIGGAQEPAPKTIPVAMTDDEQPAPMTSASRRFGKRAEPAPQPKEDYADLYADDVDEFDDDYDGDLYEDGDDGAKKGGKGSTILFWGLIVVLVFLIGGLGWFVVNKNYGGSFTNLVNSVFGGATATPGLPAGDNTPDPDGITTVDGISASIKAASLQDGTEGFEITVSAPKGSVVRIITEAQLEKDSAEVTRDDNTLTLLVPKAVFLPYTYSDTETVSVTPKLEVTTLDGKTTALTVPAVSVTLEKLTVTITDPATLTVEQKADNGAITVSGTVNDHTVEVLVNDTAVPVYEGGQFQAEVVPDVDATDGGEIVVTARKKNYVTATQTIVVTPYTVKDLALTVTNTVQNLRAEKNAVTVTGTVTAGATMKVTCSSDKVTCGETIVTANGTFSCPITISADGFYELTITGTLEGYNEGKATCIVERAPENSTTFKKACTEISTIYDKLVDGSAKTDKIVLKGKIKEIVATTPYTIVKVELSNGKTVMVCNRSLKNTLADDDINKTKEIAGTAAGLYPDTELPYIWGWFIWNK